MKLLIWLFLFSILASTFNMAEEPKCRYAVTYVIVFYDPPGFVSYPEFAYFQWKKTMMDGMKKFETKVSSGGNILRWRWNEIASSSQTAPVGYEPFTCPE